MLGKCWLSSTLNWSDNVIVNVIGYVIFDVIVNAIVNVIANFIVNVIVNVFVNVIVNVNVIFIVSVDVDVNVIVDDFALLSYLACIVWGAQCRWTMVRNPNGKLQNALFMEEIPKKSFRNLQ